MITERKYIVDIVGDLPVILMELNNSGGIVKTYIYANSQIIAQHTGDHEANRYFYLHDRLGSVRQVIDTSADVVKYYTYEPFGRTIEHGGTFDNPFRFTGQYFDSEIDQYYLRARQYDPHIARFTARDPVFGRLSRPMTLHPYLYCLNEPTNRNDPSGEWACIGHYGGGMNLTGVVGTVGISFSSAPIFFFGVEEGTYNVFWGYITFAGGGAGITVPKPLLGVSVSMMFTVGWSEGAQRPEDLAGPYTDTGFSIAAGYGGGYSRSQSLLNEDVHIDWLSVGIGVGAEFHRFAGTAWVTGASDPP